MEQHRWSDTVYPQSPRPVDPQPITRRKPLDERSADRALALATLTRREREVLGMIALGMTDRQIADELYLARITVSNHVANVLRKLDVPNRAAAAALAAAAEHAR